MKLFPALALCAAMAFSAQAAEKYKIKLASTYESNVPVLGDAPKKFKELVEKTRLLPRATFIRARTPSSCSLRPCLLV